MNQLKVLIQAIIILIVSVDMLYAQSSYDYMREQILERQRATRSQIETLDQQIEAYTERLDATTEEYEEAFNQYEELNRLISLHRERLRQMNREQNQIEEELTLIINNLDALEKRLRELIAQYRETLTYLYKHGRTTELALLLTSTSINQLIVRSFYLSKFNDYLQGQITEIETTQRQLETSREDLEETREKNQLALQNIQEETQSLQERQEQQKRTADSLKEDIANLENQKQQRVQQRENLEETMENLIMEEERIRRAKASGSATERRETVAMVTEEELQMYEEEFRELRGQLPWPVDNGTVTEKFGERVHPVFNTRTRNLGIDIAALPRSRVRVVNDGYVYGIQPLQGYGDVVFVSHGDFKTAYGNLSEIHVRRNQVLEKGDLIGLSGDENSIRGSVLFFLIRDGSQMVDPELWLQQAQL